MAKVKGMVIEVKDNSIYLVTRDGEFIKTPLTGVPPKIGDEIHVTIRPKINYLKYAAVAALLMLMMLLPVVYVYSQPAAYVCVDINPSVELSLSWKGSVKEAIGLNRDGENLLQQVDIENKPLNEAMAMLIDKAIALGYIDKTRENTIQIAYVEKRKNTVDPTLLQKTVEQELEQEKITSYLKITRAGAEALKEAREKKVSINKVILKKQYGDKIRDEDLKHPMSRIIEKVGKTRIFKPENLIKFENSKPKRTKPNLKPKPHDDTKQDKTDEKSNRPKNIPKPADPDKKTLPDRPHPFNKKKPEDSKGKNMHDTIKEKITDIDQKETDEENQWQYNNSSKIKRENTIKKGADKSINKPAVNKQGFPEKQDRTKTGKNHRQDIEEEIEKHRDESPEDDAETKKQIKEAEKNIEEKIERSFQESEEASDDESSRKEKGHQEAGKGDNDENNPEKKKASEKTSKPNKTTKISAKNQETIDVPGFIFPF